MMGIFNQSYNNVMYREKLEAENRRLREALDSIKDYLIGAQTANDFAVEVGMRACLDSALTEARVALEEKES